MTINMRPEARRFITMIDTLYNHKVGENLSLVPRPLPFLLFVLHSCTEVKSFVTLPLLCIIVLSGTRLRKAMLNSLWHGSLVDGCIMLTSR